MRSRAPLFASSDRLDNLAFSGLDLGSELLVALGFDRHFHFVVLLQVFQLAVLAITGDLRISRHFMSVLVRTVLVGHRQLSIPSHDDESFVTAILNIVRLHALAGCQNQSQCDREQRQCSIDHLASPFNARTRAARNGGYNSAIPNPRELAVLDDWLGIRFDP